MMPLKRELTTNHLIDLSGITISYTIRRSLRARRARLEIRPETGLNVVIPRRYNVEDVSGLLRLKSRWILNTLKKNAQIRPALNFKEAKNGDKIPYLGRNIDLSVQPSREKSAILSMDGNRLLLGSGPDGGPIDTLLEAWYRYRAEILLGQKITGFSSLMGIRYGRLSIRGQKTRWGSCSRTGTVCLNWKLILVPEPVIDYVIVHELAHLKEMNHSPKFWQIVAQYCPNYKTHRRFLRDYPNGGY